MFLSHSIRDATLILGLMGMLQASGLSVYVDWIEDAELDRENVNAATANRLRERMKTCRSLVYATPRTLRRRDGCLGNLVTSTGHMGRRKSPSARLSWVQVSTWDKNI